MKEILIVRFSSLGDIVLLTGVLKYVKENIAEDIAIDLLTYFHFAGVLQDYPYIRNIYTSVANLMIPGPKKTLPQLLSSLKCASYLTLRKGLN